MFLGISTGGIVLLCILVWYFEKKVEDQDQKLREMEYDREHEDDDDYEDY